MPKTAVQTRAARVGETVYPLQRPKPEVHVAEEDTDLTIAAGSVIEFPEEVTLRIPKGTPLLSPVLVTIPHDGLLDVKKGDRLAIRMPVEVTGPICDHCDPDPTVN